IRPAESGTVLMLDPAVAAAMRESLGELLAQNHSTQQEHAASVIVVAHNKIRRHVRSLLHGTFSELVVLGSSEIEFGANVEILGNISGGEAVQNFLDDEMSPAGEPRDIHTMQW